MKHKLAKTLMYDLNATYVKIIDNSHHHAGHRSAPKGGNSHFKAIVVSPCFEGLSTIKRHQKVYAVLDFKNWGIHALEIQAITPAERKS